MGAPTLKFPSNSDESRALPKIPRGQRPSWDATTRAQFVPRAQPNPVKTPHNWVRSGKRTQMIFRHLFFTTRVCMDGYTTKLLEKNWVRLVKTHVLQLPLPPTCCATVSRPRTWHRPKAESDDTPPSFAAISKSPLPLGTRVRVRGVLAFPT